MAVNKSVHGGNIQEVHHVPFDCLIRPFPSQLDENKVQSLMKCIKEQTVSVAIRMYITCTTILFQFSHI